MTFNAKHQESDQFHVDPKKAICFNCSEPFTGASVRYDGYAGNGEGEGHSIYLHVKCASEMAQRLITDAWPNRRAE
ncbi:hypothetical protein [Pseudomonas sp.]|jgi:hypothetical protein|uniref:hypothetical protein n=1 Tax=Pseudomonas sp. TaxID=306 RepID=UPI000F087DF2|nr:hypothetical protein [Pseudomonas sp.]